MNKILDLAYGSPVYLQDYWDSHNLPTNSPASFAYVREIIPELKLAITNIHTKYKNANIKDKHIVVGNGASQILTALMYVLGKPVLAQAPYFMKFPRFAQIASVPWEEASDGIRIITTPNNPDGYLSYEQNAKNAIYDLSYNWPQYSEVVNHDEDIMVFSLSKATGHASTRIGWALIRDEELAKKVTAYIELATTSVGIEAQLKASSILTHQYGADDTCFSMGKEILEYRHKIIDNLKLPMLKLSTKGMFLWLNGKDANKFFDNLNIKYTLGSAFGVSDDFIRLNLGCSDVDFKELVNRIKSHNNLLA